MKLDKKKSAGIIFVIIIILIIRFIERMKSIDFTFSTSNQIIVIVLFETVIHILFGLLSYWLIKKVFFRNHQ